MLRVTKQSKGGVLSVNDLIRMSAMTGLPTLTPPQALALLNKVSMAQRKNTQMLGAKRSMRRIGSYWTVNRQSVNLSNQPVKTASQPASQLANRLVIQSVD